MKPFNPQAYFATEWAWHDALCRTRIERIMSGFDEPLSSVRVVDDAGLIDLIEQKGWLDLWRRQGTVGNSGDPDLVFNAFRWFEEEEWASLRQRLPILQQGQGFATAMLHALFGRPTISHFEDGNRKRHERDNCCWSLHDLHTGWGCFHKCKYCQRGRVTTIMLNIEEWLERVDRLLEQNAWQKVIRFDTETDCLPLEPEYGVCVDLVRHFAGKDDRYIILFTKSDNVDFLLDLDHGGHTIMLWTLSTDTVSRLVEVDTATTAERIEAARKCQQAGYPVRLKFKPIVPIRGWREEATAMLEQLFDKVVPDNLSMEMLFFSSVDELKSMIDPSLFEPDFIRLMEDHEAAGGMQDKLKVIPPDFRVEVYTHYAREVRRLSPATPLSLCAESHAVWERMTPILGQNRDSFVCNCGPACTPGLPSGALGYDSDFKPFVAGRHPQPLQ